MIRYQAARPMAKGVGSPFGAPRLIVYGTIIEQGLAQYKTNAAVQAMDKEICGEQMMNTMLTGLQGTPDHAKTKGNLEDLAIFGNYAMSHTTKDGRQTIALSFTEGGFFHAKEKTFGLLGCYKVDLLDATLLPWLEFLTEGTAPKGPIERSHRETPQGRGTRDGRGLRQDLEAPCAPGTVG